MDVTEYIEHLRSVVPSFFNIKNISRTVLKDILGKTANDIGILQVPQSNLVSFVYFVLQEIPESIAENDKIFSNHPNNINAICMKVVLSANAKNFIEAKKHLQRLKELKDDTLQVAVAEAETAFAYSKLGPQYNMKAIKKFDDVLLEELPDQYEWKYRLALIRRRCQHPNIRKLLSTKLDISENFIKCKTLFEDIITNCSNKPLKALCLVQIADLYVEYNCRGVDFDKLGIHISRIDRHRKIMDYLDRAKNIDQNSVYTLQETGRILRNIKEFPAAKKILETVVNIQESGEAYHQLGLTIQKIEGTTTQAIDYLENASRLGSNNLVNINLGKAYIQLNPPNYMKAIECFNRIQSAEYSTQRQKYDNLSRSYKQLMYGESNRSKKNEIYLKSLEMNKESLIYGILSYIKTTTKEDIVKFNNIELFPIDPTSKNFYDRNQRDCFLRQLYAFQGKSDYTYIERLERLVKRGSLDYIKDEIKTDLDDKKYEDCLEMVLFLLITKIQGIDQVVISTMMQILKVAVESGQTALSKKCLLWPMEYFYMVDDSVGHFRILADSDNDEEAKRIKGWLVENGMIVVRNDEGISPLLDRREALLESFQGNVAVLCIVKGSKSAFLEKYPINMLPADKPLIPVLVGDSTVPNALKDHQALQLSSRNDDREKAAWLKNLGEIIFLC